MTIVNGTVLFIVNNSIIEGLWHKFNLGFPFGHLYLQQQYSGVTEQLLVLEDGGLLLKGESCWP